MLLRICLILAILAGAGVIAVSHFKVRPHIQRIIDEREQNAKDRDREKGGRLKAEKSLKETEGKLAESEKNLEETKGQLAAANSKATMLETRVTDLSKTLDQTKQSLTESQQKLSRFQLSGLEPEQIIALRDAFKGLTNENAILRDELKVALRENRRLTNELARLTSQEPDADPLMTPGLKGRVLVVDPKWDFVVLDIGQDQGVVEKGVLMVSRNSRLVAKVRVTNVQSKRSIANIMPGWKLGEVMEGDVVLY
jgi:F0F1-type ATP synthase membrane subunit b/b'